MLLAQAFSTTATQNMTKAALSYLLKDISYSELKSRVGRLSYLLQNEVGHHKRVAFIMRNSPAYITAFLALTNIRSLTIPIDPDLTDDEIAQYLRDTQVTHVFVTNDLTPRIRDLLRMQNIQAELVEIEKKRGGEYDPVYSPPADQVPVETDPILIFRTAGTTDEPKYVTFTHKQVQSCTVPLKRLYHLGGTDRIYTSLSWSHPFSFVHGMLLPVMSGVTCVIDHGAQNKELLEFFIQTRVNRIVAIPKFLQNLLLVCRSQEQTLVGIKSITVGLGSLSSQMRKIFALMKIAVTHCYGQTENVWSIFCGDTQDPMDEVDISGRPFAGFKYKVLDENGDEIEDKKGGPRIGQLAISGPTLMSGYYDKDEKKAAKESKNALRGTWLYTGDIAKLEGDTENLKITFIGRKNDLIFSEGKYIVPADLDVVIKKIKGVQDGAGFKVSDLKGKPVLACAFIRVQGSTISSEQVLAEIKSLVPPSLSPAAAVITDEIPKEMSGNPNRTRLSRKFSGVMG